MNVIEHTVYVLRAKVQAIHETGHITGLPEVTAVQITTVLDALAVAEARIDELTRKLADEHGDIRKHADAHLMGRVDQYRTRVHGGLDRLEDAIEALERGEARTALNAMKAAEHVLGGDA